MARANGTSRQTIYRGLEDPEAGAPRERVWVTGGGRKHLSARQSRLAEALEALIEPTVRADLQSALRWTWRSTRNLEAALAQAGYSVGYHTVANLLQELDYTLPGTAKVRRERWIMRIRTRNFVISATGRVWRCGAACG